MSIRLDVYIWKRVRSPLADTFYVTARYVVSGFGDLLDSAEIPNVVRRLATLGFLFSGLALQGMLSLKLLIHFLL